MGRLSKDDKLFIIKCIQHNKESYTQKASQYFKIENYREGIFQPEIDKMNYIIDKLKGANQ